MWERILDELRAGCDAEEGPDWTVGMDATVVRAHQHAAGARRAPPKDIPPQRLAVTLEEQPTPTGHTGGRIEPQEFAARRGQAT